MVVLGSVLVSKSLDELACECASPIVFCRERCGTNY